MPKPNRLPLAQFALFGLAALLQSCIFGGNKQFFDTTANPPHASTTTPAAPETPPGLPGSNVPCTAGSTTENLRILFMVDNSGSTAATDPNHTYRTKTLNSFLSAYGSHQNLTYSFGYFNGSSAKAYDFSRARFQTTVASPFGPASAMPPVLQKFDSYPPQGNTPYTAAFRALGALVHLDETSGVKQNYVVVFMSDGIPTDIYGDASIEISNLVRELRTEVESNGSSLLTVSSVYFGPDDDADSIHNLEVVARSGQGQFVDTNKLASALQINDVITVPGSCQTQ